MDKRIILALAGAASLVGYAVIAPAQSSVVRDDFQARTTHQLVDLCGTAQSDSSHPLSIAFCRGYVAAAFQYRQADNVACRPAAPRNRGDGVKLFVDWAKAHPEYANERPSDTFARFYDAEFPCSN